MDIDVQKRAGVISPLLFGHNLEHTRRCLWGGLCAQLVRNRKFAAGAGPDGVARHWHRIGPPGGLYMIERTAGKRGTGGQAYTAHHDADNPASCARQRIDNHAAGVRRGIGQRGLHLHAGRPYDCRLALLADRVMKIDVVAGRRRAALTVRPGDWSEHRFSFTARASDPDAALEITSHSAGRLLVGAASLMPADNFHGMRRDVIARLKEIGVPILRWPGGNFAGCYRWADGLLPVDRRPPLPAGGICPDTDRLDDHEIGTDEFLALCRELDAQPWITINMGLGSPDHAAAWVAYCNAPADTEWGRRRAERGHARPYGVKYWSLGNEMGWPHMAGPNEPRAYAAAALAYAAAMRRADPSIVLFGSDGPDPAAWYSTAAAVGAEAFDHISFHEYTDLVTDYDGPAARDEFRRIAAAGAGNLTALRDVRALIDAAAPGREIGISFDEWNVWHAWHRRPGVVEGIHAAVMLGMFCRHAAEVGLTFGAYFQPVNEGAILVGPDTCRLTAAGHVFALFRAHHGNTLLTLGAPTEGDLDVVASLEESAGEVVVTLANLNGDDTAEIDLLLPRAPRANVIDATVLKSPDWRPESAFTWHALAIAAAEPGLFSVAIPRHSVARVRLSCGRM